MANKKVMVAVEVNDGNVSIDGVDVTDLFRGIEKFAEAVPDGKSGSVMMTALAMRLAEHAAAYDHGKGGEEMLEAVIGIVRQTYPQLKRVLSGELEVQH